MKALAVLVRHAHTAASADCCREAETLWLSHKISSFVDWAMTSQVTGANSSVTSARRCGDVFTLSNPLGPQVCRITSDSLSASTRRAVMQAHSACVGDSLVCECNRMVVYCCCCRWPSERANERAGRPSPAHTFKSGRVLAWLCLLSWLAAEFSRSMLSTVSMSSSDPFPEWPWTPETNATLSPWLVGYTITQHCTELRW